MSFIAMNRFKVRLDLQDEFVAIWENRESKLGELKGFREFRMLKGPEGDGYRLYSSHVVWDSREDFEAWTTSEQFRASHSNEGGRKKSGESPIMGHPQFEGFEVILHES